jgi:two-component system response regulator YesN
MSSHNYQRNQAARRVLFAEDDPQTRVALAELLTRAGFVVDAAPDGKEALNLYRQNERAYDALITDHDMPDLNGLELVEKVREAQFPGKIIVVSGGLSFANASAYAALQVDKIFSKPISCRILINSLNELDEPAKETG